MNIISQIQKVSKLEDDIKSLIKSIDVYQLHKVFNYLLPKVVKKNKLVINGELEYEGTVYLTQTFVKSHGDWYIKFSNARSAGHGGFENNTKIITTKKTILIELMNRLLQNKEVSYELNMGVFKKLNEGKFENYNDDQLLPMLEYVLNSLKRNRIGHGKSNLDIRWRWAGGVEKIYKIMNFSLNEGTGTWHVQIDHPESGFTILLSDLYTEEKRNLLEELLSRRDISFKLNTNVFKKLNESNIGDQLIYDNSNYKKYKMLCHVLDKIIENRGETYLGNVIDIDTDTNYKGIFNDTDGLYKIESFVSKENDDWRNTSSLVLTPSSRETKTWFVNAKSGMSSFRSSFPLYTLPKNNMDDLLVDLLKMDGVSGILNANVFKKLNEQATERQKINGLINPQLNQKLEEYIDTKLGTNVFIDFSLEGDIENNEHVTLDPSRGFGNDIRITYLYYLDNDRYTGYCFETDADSRDEKNYEIIDISPSELIKSEAKGIIKYLSKWVPEFQDMAQELTNTAFKKLNENNIFDNIGDDKLFDMIKFILDNLYSKIESDASIEHDSNFLINKKYQIFEIYLLHYEESVSIGENPWVFQAKNINDDYADMPDWMSDYEIEELSYEDQRLLLKELLNREDVNYLLNSGIFKKINESKSNKYIKSFTHFKI